MSAIELAQKGLDRHRMVDQCTCSSCREYWGPEGSPGRCGVCYSSEPGDVCVEAKTYRAILDALTPNPGKE